MLYQIWLSVFNAPKKLFPIRVKIAQKKIVTSNFCFVLSYTILINGASRYATSMKSKNQSPLCRVQNGIVVKNNGMDKRLSPDSAHNIILAGITISKLGTRMRRNLCLYHFQYPPPEILAVENAIPIPESRMNISTP